MYRMILVTNHGNTAHYQGLVSLRFLSQCLVKVDIQDHCHIELPQTPLQRQQWETLMVNYN